MSGHGRVAATLGQDDRARVHLARVLLAAGGGLAIAASGSPYDLWPFAPVGVALALLAVRGRTPGAAFALGFITGATQYAVHISWITVYLGPAPLLGLTIVMATWFGLGGIASASVWRLVRAARWLSTVLATIGLAAVWTTRELLASTIPWGGFSWGRLAYSQADSPFGPVVGWAGIAGLTFAIALLGATAAVTVRSASRAHVTRRAVAPVAVAAILALVPAVPVEYDGTIRVGAAQGASEAGLLAPYEPGQIIAEHAAATTLLDGENLDLLVWPENAGEREPQTNPQTIALLEDLQRQFTAPIILGAVTTEGTRTYNSLLLWDEGVDAVYHKRHPVPFAEYLPSRAVLAPVLDAFGFLDLIPRDFSIDPASANVFDVGGVRAGLAICFDVVDDALAREMVLDRGAQLILVPSNNADFGEGSAQNVQQLAIARLRAMESGRSLVMISTVGTSAIVLADGSILQRLPQYEPGAMVATLPLSATVTPAIRFGRGIEVAIAIAALLTVLAGAGASPARRAFR